MAIPARHPLAMESTTKVGTPAIVAPTVESVVVQPRAQIDRGENCWALQPKGQLCQR